MTKSDCYSRNIIKSMDEDQAREFVSARVKEVIDNTRKTRLKVEQTIGKLKMQ